MQRKFRALSWKVLNRALDIIVLRMKQSGFASRIVGIVGVPRGGLVPAVALSHKLKKPLFMHDPFKPLPDEGAGWLIVDDILDSGFTQREIAKVNRRAVMAVVVRAEMDGVDKAYCRFAGLYHCRDTWFVFPWEDKVRAKVELISYNKAEERREREEIENDPQIWKKLKLAKRKKLK